MLGLLKYDKSWDKPKGVALPDVACVAAAAAAAEATVRRLLAEEAFPVPVRKTCADGAPKFRNATSTDYQARIGASTSWVRSATGLPGERHHLGEGSRDIEAAVAVPSSARAAVPRFDDDNEKSPQFS